MSVEPGGGCNFVIAARRLGIDVSVIGALGDDMFGSQLVQTLELEGVNTQGIVVHHDSRTTVVYTLIDLDKKEHVFIGCFGDKHEITYSDAIAAITTSSDALFLQAYNLEEAQIAVLLRIVEAGRAKDIPVYFDVGAVVRHVPFERIRGLIERADVLFLTEDELSLVAQDHSGDSAFEFLLGLGPDTLIVKQGGDGCTAVRRDHYEQVLGFRVPVVDTVGAGDCFDAAFVCAQLLGFNLHDSCIFANAAGAASVQKIGAGRNIPTCAEVKTVLSAAGVALDLLC